MSIKEMGRVWSESKQSNNPLLLMLAIADNANDNGYCYPGINYLAKKVRVSERTILRMIIALEKSGELAVVHRRKVGNAYMILTGCNSEELALRRKLLSDIFESKYDNLAGISDTVTAKLPTTVSKPSIEPKAAALLSLWEKETKTPAPGTILLDQLAFMVEEYSEARVREACRIAYQRVIEGKLRAVTVQYVRGILRSEGKPNGNGKAKPPEPARPPRKELKADPNEPTLEERQRTMAKWRAQQQKGGAL